jgi:hypothetical protein
VTEERSPLETALDIFVFAPVGVFLTLTEDLPKLVERGKSHLQSQLGMARMMGEMAAPQLRDEATKMAKGLMDRMAPPGPPPAASRPTPTPSAPKDPPAPPASASEANGAAPDEVVPAGSPDPVTGPLSGRPAIADPDSLAIPGYDSLSAMQVVQRLAGLKQGELDAVRRYEEGHRRRKTIIHRAEQLLAEAG